jgi:hypothetical protein
MPAVPYRAQRPLPSFPLPSEGHPAYISMSLLMLSHSSSCVVFGAAGSFSLFAAGVGSIRRPPFPPSLDLLLLPFSIPSSNTLSFRRPSRRPHRAPGLRLQRPHQASPTTMPDNLKQYPNVPLQRFLAEPRAQGSTVPVIASAKNSVLVKKKEMAVHLAGWDENWEQLKASR